MPPTNDATREGLSDAEEFSRLEPEEQAAELRAAPPDDAATRFRDLQPDHQASLLDLLPQQETRQLLVALRPDERARLLATVGDERETELLELIPEAERATTLQLVRYPAESVGRMMTPNVLALDPATARADALEQVRACSPEVETVYTLPVVDGERLVGVVDLRRLLTAPDGARVEDVMAPPDSTLAPLQDQEVASRLVLSTELLAVPVVDDGGRLLGLVTVDDAMEVLDLEQGEDVLRTSGSEPIGAPYLSASFLRLARSRALWLLIAVIAATLTVNVLEIFESELGEVVSLTLFIPLLLGTGGNAGSQATATITRALAVGNVRVADLLRVVWREVRVGIALGGLLGVLALTPVWLLYDSQLATVVALTLLTICTIATVIGATLPLLAERAGLDPAVVSAPFITTIVDASGLLVYFLYARAVFGL